jgi:phosphoribosylformylglycinamidine synthase
MINSGWILSGHDISDGGVITTLCEMSFASGIGFNVDINSDGFPFTDNRFEFEKNISVLFSEEAGVIIEIPQKIRKNAVSLLNTCNLTFDILGYTTDVGYIDVKIDGKKMLSAEIVKLRQAWESTSFELEKLQCNINCAKKESIQFCSSAVSKDRECKQYCSDSIWETFYPKNWGNYSLKNSLTPKPRVAIIREEGSNGDREMCAAFYQAGFDCYDIMTSDMVKEDSNIDLQKFQGIVFVGGFTFSDVLGAAKGWESIIRHNKRVMKQFDWYYSDNNSSKFSLGVCNGCQLMVGMGWIGNNHVKIMRNNSGRFESRYLPVQMYYENRDNYKCVLLEGMNNAELGVWIAHGEGCFILLDTNVNICMRYRSPYYPMNPNGSTSNIAGINSDNGLHLAMMPHPERCIKSWQNPYYPRKWQSRIDGTYDGMTMPWMKLFKNAYDFAMKNFN